MRQYASRGYCCVGLYNPKDHYNVGGVLRAAGAFGVHIVFYTGRRYRQASTDTTAQYRHTPLIHADDLFSVIPYDCIPLAIELKENARPLINYVHPERAFYIFGPEDGSVPTEIVKRCKDTLYIPTAGCLNLACCVNVVLYDRLSKYLISRGINSLKEEK